MTTTYDEFKTALQAAVDGLPSEWEETAALRAAAGAPGDTVTLPGDEKRNTGAIWEEREGSVIILLGVLLKAVGDTMDSAGIGQVAGIAEKLNELIGEYNQLREDYNSSTVPTTAKEVDPL
jgi:hypothetical protein